VRFLQKPEPENLDSEEIPGWDKVTYRKACKRVRVMSVRELLDWTDVAGSGMARCLMDYRKQQDMASLLEVRNTLITMYALVTELMVRDETRNTLAHRPGRE
jgi:hypothetical protein